MQAAAERGAARWRSVLTGVLFVAMILGGQAISDVSEPQADGTATADAVGRASFAYLSGLRTYGAALLWNRVHPIMHHYYEGTGLRDMRFMVPTINIAVTLDPQLIDAYYVGSWIVGTNGETEQGLALARRGAEANPESGVLIVAYAQALELWAEDLDAAHAQAIVALGPDIEWRDDIEKHDSYAIVGSIMRLYGDEERSDIVMEEIERLDEAIGDELPEGSHDHDGDGVPDH